MLATLVPLFFVVVAVAALLGCVLFWYEALNSPEPRLPAPQPGVFSCLRVYVDCFFSFALCALLYPLGPFVRRKPRGMVKNAAPPLILVHGLYHNASSWVFLGRFLARKDYAVSTFDYKLRSSSPVEICQSFEEHVRAVEAAYPESSPLLVGHSLGGLIIRNWLKEPANAGRIAGVVTLGTPHHGSGLARLGPGKLAAHLVPGSEFLKDLEAAPALAPLPCVALVSPTDGAVLPASCLMPPDDWKLAAVPESGHVAMLYKPCVAEIVLAELEEMRRGDA